MTDSSTPPSPAASPRRRDPVLTGLFAGIACGLFFGEGTRILETVSDGFIRLLQMAVLPYIVVSLTAAVGRLKPRDVGFLARRGGALMVVLWAITLLLVVAMPLAFPSRPHGNFFSTTLLEPQADFDLVRLYIPDNPFRSLSDNVVPSVVLFCLAVGVALTGVAGREPFIAQLDVLTRALDRVNGFVSRIMPFGVFAIAATAAGRLGFEEIGRIQVYLVTYVALAVLASVWLLPSLLTALTGVPVRAVLRASRETLVAAVSTGSLLLVLPSLTHAARELAARAAPDDDETRSTIDVLVPISFNFPHGGKVLTLGFVVFAAWFAGRPLGIADLPRFALVGLLATFGSMNAALPFLLDTFRLPADLFQLFLTMSVIGFRFQTLVGAMHTLVLTVLGTCAVRGSLAVRWPAILRAALVGIALTAGTLLGVRTLLARTVTGTGPDASLVRARTLLVDPVPATVLRADGPARPGTASALERVADTGELRVGYLPARLPFSYFNEGDQLVGFDIDMVHRLAAELHARLVFVPLRRDRLAEQLAAGEFDLAVGALEITTELSRHVGLTTPYLNLTLGLVVEDARRTRFSSREALRAQRGLRLGIVLDGYYEAKLRAYVPTAEIVRLGAAKEFFEGGGLGLDALVLPAEIGAAWTLLYPAYTVVTPHPDRLEAPIAYALARGDNEFGKFLDTWLLLKREDRTIERLRRYWIHGLDDRPRPPRWSVVRDVLHWVD